jgi:uridine phosphorylase
MNDSCSYPNYPHKHHEASFVSPEETLQNTVRRADFDVGPPPEAAILIYQRSLWDAITADPSPVEASSPTGAMAQSLFHMRTLAATDHRVGVIGGFGIGAPVTCIVLEGLIAYGVRRFVSVGFAGSLQADLVIGDLVVCERAIRDEGTSHHYVAPAKYAPASPPMVGRLISTLDRKGLPYRVGTGWTVDAPYRETHAEIRHYGREGVLTVDMEASAVFAVAAYRGVEMGALFAISDQLAGAKWEHRFHGEEALDSLRTLYEVALESLTAEAGKPTARPKPDAPPPSQ